MPLTDTQKAAIDFFNKAKTAFSNQQPHEAMENLQKCIVLLEKAPDDNLMYATNVLARDIATMAGHFDGAIQLTNVLLEKDRLPQEEKTAHHYMLGQLHFILKDYDQARSFLRRPNVKKKFSDSPDYHFKCEYIRVLRNDDVHETLGSYADMLQCHPDSLEFLMKRFFLTFLFKLVHTRSITTTEGVLASDPSIKADYQKLVGSGLCIDDVLSSVNVLQ